MIDPRIVAHRGWTESHLENTREALEAAVAGGCAAVEFDVRRTGDGHWVLYHDADLARLDGAQLLVDETPLAKLREHAQLPLLAEALEIVGDRVLPMVEIKVTEPDALTDLGPLLVAHDAPTVVVARSQEVVDYLERATPAAHIYLYQRNWQAAVAAPGAALAGYDLWAMGATPARAAESLTALRREGRKVAVWTINDVSTARAWLDAGVDWIITDRPWEMTREALTASGG